MVDQIKVVYNKMNIPQIEAKFKFKKSKATIKYTLQPKEQILRITIHTDIQTPKIMLKYQIPLTIKSYDVKAEIPYASISRKRQKRTEMEKAKWEMPMQKWIDVSEREYGITIVNNNRYGFAATPNSIYITLTRTPIHPDPKYFGTYRSIPKNIRPKFTDLKAYTFELGLIPHKGDSLSSNAWQSGYDFNIPIINPEQFPRVSAELESAEKKISSKKKPSMKLIQDNMKKSFVQSISQNILISVIKPSEWSGKEFEKIVSSKEYNWDCKSFILRLVEQNGENCQTTIKFAEYLKIHRVEEVNLLEMSPEKPMEIRTNTINMNFHKFEIKTLRVVLK